MQVATKFREAKFYESGSGSSVICRLCPHRCHIESGARGICHVRENRDGILYTSTFGRLTNKSIDPVEKKPLYHFHPGSTSYSISSYGCNLRCQYCINAAIAQVSNDDAPDVEMFAAETIVSETKSAGCSSIAYTYVEPTIFYEYIEDVSRLARAAGIWNLYKTNGFMSPELIESGALNMDAANVDLKCFNETTYQQFGGRLQPILENLKLMKKAGIWVEVTTLIIPDLNDSVAELKALAGFISRELGVDTPWHLTRFFPAFKMSDRSPTPVASLERARQIGFEEGLQYIYISNVPISGYQDTVCPQCSRILIKRHGFTLLSNFVDDNHCSGCGIRIAGPIG